MGHLKGGVGERFRNDPTVRFFSRLCLRCVERNCISNILILEVFELYDVTGPKILQFPCCRAFYIFRIDVYTPNIFTCCVEHDRPIQLQCCKCQVGATSVANLLPLAGLASVTMLWLYIFETFESSCWPMSFAGIGLACFCMTETVDGWGTPFLTRGSEGWYQRSIVFRGFLPLLGFCDHRSWRPEGRPSFYGERSLVVPGSTFCNAIVFTADNWGAEKAASPTGARPWGQPIHDHSSAAYQ
jgi:hypothetical protein